MRPKFKIHLLGKKHDPEKTVKTTGANERSFITVEQGTESEDSEEEPVEMRYISGLPVSCTSEISSPEHGRSYSPISSVGSCDFDVVDRLGDSDDNVMSGLSTVSEYCNTDELNSPSSLQSNKNELKSERLEVDGEKFASDADWSRDGYSSSERGSLKGREKENRSDIRSRLHRHSSKITSGKSEKNIGCTSSPGRTRDEHRGVHSDDSRYRRSKKRSTSRESSRPNKERSPDRYRPSSGRKDDGSRSKSSKSTKSKREQVKSGHRSATKHSTSSRHSRQRKRSRERGSRDRSRDRSPDTESRSRRKRRSRSSSIRANSRKARSRSNSSMSSNSSNDGDHHRRKRRSTMTNEGKKRKIDLSDEVLLGMLNYLRKRERACGFHTRLLNKEKQL